MFQLPQLGKAAIPLLHFPTRYQAFIFRAYEYVPPSKIAQLLGTTEERVRQAAQDMGLTKACDSNIWLEKGYITIIRRLWHILPYEQLLELLEMDSKSLAIILKEEDFLDIKLGNKPVCEPVAFRDLTEKETEQTGYIKEVVQALDMQGTEPFAFQYDVKDMGFSGRQHFNIRMTHGFSGLYQKAFDIDSEEYFPDSMLEAYQKVGVNAVWTQAVLYQLTEYPFDKSLSAGYHKRLARLKAFTERCDKYGIKVFLYLNEPRSMPESFFEKHPHMRGHKARENKICLCTSNREVQDYLTEGVAFICKEVPKIGGFFTITRSENVTNCYSHCRQSNCTCPRCSKRSESDVIAEVIGCMEKGAHKVNPEIKVIAWSWNWNEFHLDIIKKLPEHVILLSQSERFIPFTIGGISGRERDYSMSIIGPGEWAKAEWKAAKERGLELMAKIQVNTTWECSTVPALPVYPLIEEHIRRIKEEGVENLMLSWTLGGYPSGNIIHAAKYFYERYDETALEETEAQKKAGEIFSHAFQEFPFDAGVLYKGPQNAGPANLLYLEPTGYNATMTCYAYDDIDSWRSIYPREVYEAQLCKLCSKWEEGLRLLEQERLERDSGQTLPQSEMEIMAAAAYCLFKSSLNQFRFYLAREKQDKEVMLEQAEAELVCARKMLDMMNLNAAIGFEAANHYYFSKGCLVEKLVNCDYVIRQLEHT
ncbi:MAG: hypothetical protein IKK59_03915 [Lachnospiraceae bacterium]|nr:hypothetical protein [Lachnospiraceae bacterium]